MALNVSALSSLMRAIFSIFTTGSKDEFDSYAEGVIEGLKLGTVNIITTGVAGSPGQGTFVGAIQGGPIIMASLVAANSVGVMPPLPEGLPTPLQVLWYLAIAQIATHILIALQVDANPIDGVSTGIGVITPGGFAINGGLISQLIKVAYLKRGLVVTPRRAQVAQVIGNSTEQLMVLATMFIPIIGGTPTVPTGPAAGTRTGIIS